MRWNEAHVSGAAQTSAEFVTIDVTDLSYQTITITRRPPALIFFAFEKNGQSFLSGKCA
jgi:hypothetical protein